MVFYADAVIYPFAVMVKAVDTLLADVAMFGSGAQNNLAFRTDVLEVHTLHN